MDHGSVELRQRMGELEANLAETRRAIEGLAQPAVVPDVIRTHDETEAASQQAAALQQLQERLQALEQELAQMNSTMVERQRLAELGGLRGLVFQRQELDPEAIGKLQTQACDRTLSEEQRLQSLRQLRHSRSGQEDRTLAVTNAMIELYRDSEDAGVRADVFRQLHGVSYTELKQPLLDALVHDPSCKVREEAAETLDHYLDDPYVREALEQALRDDEDSGVRRQAAESLTESRER
jgi:hypothetical protein